MLTDPTSLWIQACIAAMLVSLIAYRLRALAPSGAVASTLLGTVIVGTSGWWPGVILVAFFLSSSALSQIRKTSSVQQARGSRRDWVQVLANGGGALVCCALYGLTGWTPWLTGAVGSISAATGDTWSSEIGRTSTAAPRLITTLKLAPKGTSGAVSIRGILASFAGGLLISLVWIFGQWQGWLPSMGSAWIPAGSIALAGLLGSILDSILGATIQEQRWCPTCEVVTEANPHRCGAPTEHAGGIRGFNNDAVNAACTAFGGIIALVSGII